MAHCATRQRLGVRRARAPLSLGLKHREPQHLHQVFDIASPIESAALAPRTPKRFATSDITEMWAKIRQGRHTPKTQSVV